MEAITEYYVLTTAGSRTSLHQIFIFVVEPDLDLVLEVVVRSPGR
jgi:hypothetical protein